MALVIFRIIITFKLTYIFYAWNTLLAIVPYLLSRRLSLHKKINLKSYFLIATWLLFFPNAPYLITDIVHYFERPPVPKWYDLLLVISAAWNGLLIGILSLMQVEYFLQKFITKNWLKIFIGMSLILCSFGIFIGRFLRFNSWDILTNPDDLLLTSLEYFIKPWRHTNAWSFIVLFAILLGIVYYTFRNIASSFKNLTRNIE